MFSYLHQTLYNPQFPEQGLQLFALTSDIQKKGQTFHCYKPHKNADRCTNSCSWKGMIVGIPSVGEQGEIETHCLIKRSKSLVVPTTHKQLAHCHISASLLLKLAWIMCAV